LDTRIANGLAAAETLAPRLGFLILQQVQISGRPDHRALVAFLACWVRNTSGWLSPNPGVGRIVAGAQGYPDRHCLARVAEFVEIADQKPEYGFCCQRNSTPCPEQAVVPDCSDNRNPARAGRRALGTRPASWPTEKENNSTGKGWAKPPLTRFYRNYLTQLWPSANPSVLSLMFIISSRTPNSLESSAKL